MAELTDGRIILRTPGPDDAPGVAEAARRSLPELQPWMPWATDDYDVDDAREWIGRFGGEDTHPFVIVEDDEIVGTAGLNRIDALNSIANLGYWLRSDRIGRGIATAATRLIADFGHQQVGLHRLEIIMSVRNHASRRVAERVGATHEGVLRGALLLHGEHHDVHLFSLLPGDI